MSRRSQLAIILGTLAVTLGVALYDALHSTVTVTALDGTQVVIRLDPEEVTEWSGAGAMSADGTRKYGVSVKPPMDLPDGNPNEINMVGTTGPGR